MLAAVAFAAFCFCLLYKTSGGGGGAKRLLLLVGKASGGKRKGVGENVLWGEEDLEYFMVKFTTTTTTSRGKKINK